MKKYAITPDFSFQTQEKTLNLIKNGQINMLQLRDKKADSKKTLAFIDYLKSHIDIKELNTDIFINSSNDFWLSSGKRISSSCSLIKGVHCNFESFQDYTLSKNIDLIYSAHSLKEIIDPRYKVIKYFTFSPIFRTLSHPEETRIQGIEKLREVLELAKPKKIIALGGIDNDYKIKIIDQLGCYGFAAISYFFML